MAIHIALLRAVNVAGSGRLAMAELRSTLAGLGLAGVRTVLQSGNLVFESHSLTGAQLESRVADQLALRLGLVTTVIVRTAAQWRAIMESNPFPDDAARDPSHLVVLACASPPSPAAVDALQTAICDRERVQSAGGDVFALYPDGIGRSRLTNALIERHLRTRVTGRNWNTVLKIAAAAGV